MNYCFGNSIQKHCQRFEYINDHYTIPWFFLYYIKQAWSIRSGGFILQDQKRRKDYLGVRGLKGHILEIVVKGGVANKFFLFILCFWATSVSLRNYFWFWAWKSLLAGSSGSDGELNPGWPQARQVPYYCIIISALKTLFWKWPGSKYFRICGL